MIYVNCCIYCNFLAFDESTIKEITYLLYLDGIIDQSLDGINDHSLDGIIDHSLDGIIDHSLDGIIDHSLDGIIDHSLDGIIDHSLDGIFAYVYRNIEAFVSPRITDRSSTQAGRTQAISVWGHTLPSVWWQTACTRAGRCGVGSSWGSSTPRTLPRFHPEGTSCAGSCSCSTSRWCTSHFLNAWKQLNAWNAWWAEMNKCKRMHAEECMQNNACRRMHAE